MVFRILFVFSNVLFAYSNSQSYFNFEKTFSLDNNISNGKEYYINPLKSNVFINFSVEDDTFNYNNLQENEELNLEKDIKPDWGKKLFRFSAISIGSFPLAFFLSLFIYDISYYFYKNMDPRYSPFLSSTGITKGTEFMYKIIISVSISALLSLTIALIDFALQ